MSTIRPWRQLTSEVVATGKLFAVRRDQVELPGRPSEPIEYTYLDQPPAVVVVPQPDPAHVLVIEQYRYPIGARSVEFPAGSLEDGEAPEAAARRELTEEIGVQAGELHHLGTCYPTVAVTTTQIHVFLARELQAGQPHREATEQLEVRRVTLDEVGRLISAGAIMDSASIIAYFYLLRHLGRPPT
jgi:ADP-ribose pyrophosphatase